MPRPLRPIAEGLVYHVINRGNNRQPVFVTEGDYRAFLKTQADLKQRWPFACYDYCLMRFGSSTPRILAGGVQMQKAGLVRTLKTIVAVLLVNGVFYAFYRIAAIHLQLSQAVFAVGCVALSLVVVAICRRFEQKKEQKKGHR